MRRSVPPVWAGVAGSFSAKSEAGTVTPAIVRGGVTGCHEDNAPKTMVDYGKQCTA
jgi:hypothetical protein